MIDWTKIEAYLATLTPKRLKEIRDSPDPTGLGEIIARYVKRG